MTRTSLFAAGALLAVAAGSAAAAISDPVQLDAGRVAGGQPLDGVRVFKGIPFAAPPVGELRWRAPRPVEPWEDVRAATEFGDVCVQPPGQGRLNIAVLPDGPGMSEDCLYLNVWTPAESASDALPVMVYIYGGAYTEGAGSVPLYDGTELARKGAVVVTMNYRLGPFGFFAHPDLTAEAEHGSSGNYGLMDMLASLEWVQRNIAGFGGDPDNVTVFGQSAGAMAIASLVASPEADGLFRRAISQSGAWMGLGMGRMRNLEQAEEAGVRAVAELGAESIAQLRALPADEVQQKLRGAGVVIDGHVLPEDVSAVFAEGRQNDVDVLVGSNADEGSFFPGGPAAEQFRNQQSARWGALADRFFEQYPAGTDEQAAAASAAAFRDGTAWHMRLFASYQAEQGNEAWVYYFAQDPPPADEQRPLGATHAAEVPYVFNNIGELPLFPDGSDPEKAARSEPDLKLADMMSSYWVNFARTGDPNGPGLPEWPPFEDLREGQAMVLEADARPEQLPDPAKLALYDALYERQLSGD
ncbi:MAG: carboxylesterase family protein [Gammaproteobacteria bacterium]|nr:carboxylesterase family protein [Gammaproteobacteria bacterium]